MPIWIALVACATGCAAQLAFYAGPRVDAAGDVGAELGMVLGGGGFAARAGRQAGAVVATVDGSAGVARGACGGCAVPRMPEQSGPPASELRQRGSIRGGLEWIERPRATGPGYVRTPSVGWRAGVYGGVEIPAPGVVLGLVGVTAAVSPWVWWYDGHTGGSGPFPGAHEEQWLAIGFQLGGDLIPAESRGHRFVGRAAVVVEFLDWPFKN